MSAAGNTSMRDRMIMAILGVVVAYGLLVALWFMVENRNWAAEERKWKKARTTREQEKKLIARRAYWFDAYDSEREKMPVFAERNKSVDTHWMDRMDQLALDYGIDISRRQSGKERQVGDVYELDVDVRDWEGSLDALVKFAFALENAPEAMFDVRSIQVRPSSRKGYLKGSFVLACAYMRGDDDASAEDAAARRGGKATKKKETME